MESSITGHSKLGEEKMKEILDNYTIRHLLERSTQKFDQRLALSTVGSEEDGLTYTALKRKVDALATFLINKGVEKGTHIALLGESQINWAIAYLAIVSAGCVALPILPEFSEPEIREIFIHSGVTVAIVAGKHYPKIGDLNTKEENILIRLDDLFMFPTQLPKSLGVSRSLVKGPALIPCGQKLNIRKLSQDLPKRRTSPQSSTPVAPQGNPKG